MINSENMSEKYVNRKAIIYVRQSSPHQVLTNQESLKLQYSLKKKALELGWDERNVETIDSDLGSTGSTTETRQGFKELVTLVTMGQVGH
jgi:DNA invertase Pin-like site-specific DNA recombinase